jgi:hypothetical protein
MLHIPYVKGKSDYIAVSCVLFRASYKFIRVHKSSIVRTGCSYLTMIKGAHFKKSKYLLHSKVTNWDATMHIARRNVFMNVTLSLGQ